MPLWDHFRTPPHGSEADIDSDVRGPPPHPRLPPDSRHQTPSKGNTVKIIAKVIESMLSKDATQTWTGQTSAVASQDTWHWGGFSE